MIGYKLTDVSGEPAATIFKVENWAELKILDMWTEGRAVTLRPRSPDYRRTGSAAQESTLLFTQLGRMAVV